jgi:iron complex outermembrane receptor protein
MKNKNLLRSSLVASLLLASMLTANPISIETITINDDVQDEEALFLADVNLSEASDVQTFSTKSLATLGTHANMNPYTVINFSPSVNFTPVDSSGSNEPSYHDPIRIRGKIQSGPGGVYMINSTPISSNPGGGKQMIDMENVSSLDLLKGYLPTDKNLGFSSLIGKVDMHVLKPSDKPKATISQSLGKDNFHRTFLRLDTGKIGDVSVFGSISYLGNDKTKGEGSLERLNGMVGLSYEPSDALEVNIYAIKNLDEHHNYYSLSYAESQDLGSFFNKDFATTKPTASNDVNYYDWNRQQFNTTDIFSDINIKLSQTDKIIIKPYYKQDKGEYWYSNMEKSLVMNWQMDHDLYGAVSSYEHIFSQALKSKIGYWYHKQLPPGPPNDQRKYKVESGELAFAGYSALAETGYHSIAAPFVELSGELNNFSYALGLQYQSFTLGSIDSYTGTNAATSTDYDTAIANATLDPWSSVEERTMYTYLPSLYLGYKPSDETSLYVDYSRTYGFDVNLFPTYLSNRAAFVAKDVTLQELWDKLKLETSDNINVGMKTNIGAVTMNPNFFVSFIKNKQANAYDPEFGVNYPANVGDAFGYGAEYSASGPLTENLEFLIGLSYNKYAYSQNFLNAASSSTDIKGNQLPDAPEIMAKGALSYYLSKWVFTPSLRYTSSRYGDVENTQKIDAFTVVDLDVAYKAGSFLGSSSSLFRMTATNLTNEQYIGVINSADNVLAASTTSSTYQTGAPLGVYFSANLKY